MNSSDLCFPSSYDAAVQHARIRWALFAVREVVDVLPTLHADTLRVRHRGDADPEGWALALVSAGFPAPRVEPAPVAPRRREAAVGSVD